MPWFSWVAWLAFIGKFLLICFSLSCRFGCFLGLLFYFPLFFLAFLLCSFFQLTWVFFLSWLVLLYCFSCEQLWKGLEGWHTNFLCYEMPNISQCLLYCNATTRSQIFSSAGSIKRESREVTNISLHIIATIFLSFPPRLTSFLLIAYKSRVLSPTFLKFGSDYFLN